MICMQVAAAVSKHIQGGQGGPPFPALQNLGRGIKDALPGLRRDIRHCIEVKACCLPAHGALSHSSAAATHLN